MVTLRDAALLVDHDFDDCRAPSPAASSLGVQLRHVLPDGDRRASPPCRPSCRRGSDRAPARAAERGAAARRPASAARAAERSPPPTGRGSRRRASRRSRQPAAHVRIVEQRDHLAELRRGGHVVLAIEERLGLAVAAVGDVGQQALAHVGERRRARAATLRPRRADTTGSAVTTAAIALSASRAAAERQQAERAVLFDRLAVRDRGAGVAAGCRSFSTASASS